jgi:hypothetical protein
MWKHSAPIEKDWAGPTKTTSTSGYTKPTTSSSTTPVKTTKKAETKVVTATAQKGADDDRGQLVDAQVVEVEIAPTEGIKKAMEHVSALGLVVNYDTTKELATSIGVKEADLKDMSGVVLANKLAALHFGIGHGSAMLHAKSEIAEVRRKAAAKDSKMEKMAEKQKSAESHIWEYRQLVTIVCALHKGRYKMNAHNVGIALSAFEQLDSKRSADILGAAKYLMENADTQKLIDQLVEGFRQAEPRNKKSAESS